MPSSIDVRRADSRFHTTISWLDSWHSFSFGNHYDPDNTHHGLLLVHNDDRVAPGMGFGTHAHRDMEIVTWVLSGRLEHRDSEGNHGEIVPGLAQRMSAGTGIRHSEMNASRDEPVHFLQMWVPPDTNGLSPGYEQRDVSASLGRGALVAVASGRGHDGAVHLNQRGAVMWAAALAAGASVEVPAATHVHVFIAEGEASLAEGEARLADGGVALATGDAVRATAGGARQLTAGPDGAHVVIWETD